LNPWWLRPTAEGASENPREADDAGGGEAGRDDAAGEKSGSEKKSGSKTTAASKKTASTKTGGDRPADPAPAASPRARSRGGRSRQPKGGAEKAPAAAEAAGVKKNGKTDEPAVASPAAERSRRRPRGRGDDEPDAPPDLTFDDDITSADFAELRRELDSPPERNRPVSDELKIAMFCDLENIAIGVRDSAIKKFDINLILERLLEKGKIIVKKAYCDWERYNDYKRPFHEAAIEMIEIPQKHYSGKNSADIKMVVDAMDLCYSKEHLDTFVIVSGDSDFSPLVSKLKENDKTVIGVGVKDASSALLIANCDEFIYYEDIWRDRQSAPTVEAPDKKKSEAFRLMVDAMQALARENKDVLWGSMIKQTMQRKKPSFNEGYYGYSTFSDLLEDAERNNLIKLKKDQRSGTYIVTGFSGRGGR
jgi:uncharacterized protein (TIGR00288 family)